MPERTLEIPSFEDIRRILGNDDATDPPPATPTDADDTIPRTGDSMENDDD